MLFDRDIWQAATVMRKRYGSDALGEAERRSEELVGDGDTLGAMTWYRITAAILELQKPAPEGPSTERADLTGETRHRGEQIGLFVN